MSWMSKIVTDISVFVVHHACYSVWWASVALVNLMKVLIVIHNFDLVVKSTTVEINHSENHSVHVLLKVLGQIEFFSDI